MGTVIVGEIGDIKRAIVFNGDVMNTAARLEEQSRNVEGGFLASRAAIDRFKSAPPVPLRDLGMRDIRGRSDGIAVVGLATWLERKCPARGRAFARTTVRSAYFTTSYLPFFTVRMMRERSSVPKRFFSVKL